MSTPDLATTTGTTTDGPETTSTRRVTVGLALTHWIDELTGRRLTARELRDARRHAHETYEANTHIFEDEADALTALGVVPLAAA